MMENDEENIQPAYIFLPGCAHSDNDVFLNVVRAIIGRSNIDKNPMNNSLIRGMNASTIRIQSEDVGPWNDLNSPSHQIRQAQMLGYWSIKHFPSFAIRLCGDTWKAPQRQCVQVDGSDTITPNDFDSLIFDKLKLRIIELRVDHGTLQRLKNFIKAPTNIGKENRFRHSNKMFSFDIEKGFDRQGWDALRSGVFSSSNVNECTDGASDSTVQLLTHSSLLTNREVSQNSSTFPNSSHLAKRPRREHSTDVNTTSSANDQLTTESLQAILVLIQRDVKNLTDWLNPGHNSEDGPQQAYLKVIADKDVMIATLKRNTDQLRDDVESLKNQNAKLNHQVESNVGLINSLQKGVDANFILYSKSEAQLTVLQGSIAIKDETISTQEKELEIVKMTVKSLQTQLNSMTNEAPVEASALETQIEELNRNLNETTAAKEKELEESKSETKELNVRLDNLLKEYKLYEAAKQKELEESKREAEKLKEQVNSQNIETEEIVLQMRNVIEKLEQELTELTTKKLTSDQLLQDWKSNGEAKDREIDIAKSTEAELKSQVEELKRSQNEATAKNVTLENLLKGWKSYEAAKEKELEESKSETKELNVRLDNLLKEYKLYEAAKQKELEESKREAEKLKEQVNSQNIETEEIVLQMRNGIEKLEQELTELTTKKLTSDQLLQDWKSNGEAKDREIDIARSTEAELKSQVEELKRSQNEATAKNVTLENLLNGWKSYEAAKERELEESKREAEKLKKQVNSLNIGNEKIVLEMKNNMAVLERELISKNRQVESMLNQSEACEYDTDKGFGEAYGQKSGIVERSMAKVTDVRMDAQQTSNEDKFMDPSPKQLPHIDTEFTFHHDDNFPAYQNEFSDDNTSETTRRNENAKELDTSLMKNEAQLPIPDNCLPKDLSHENSKSSSIDEAANFEQNVDHRNESQEFQTDDEIVRACRPILIRQRFGWIRFNSNKNCRAYPGFVYQPDEDGHVRAQRITPNGYVSDAKNIFSRCDESIPENEKGRAQVKALKIFNEKFHFNFV